MVVRARNAGPIGGLSLNFGRLQDDVIDENLQIIKTNPDEAARQEAAEAINRRFGEQVYYLWNTWALWGIPTLPSVNDIEAEHPARRRARASGWPFAGGSPGQPDLVRRGGLRVVEEVCRR